MKPRGVLTIGTNSDEGDPSYISGMRAVVYPTI